MADNNYSKGGAGKAGKSKTVSTGSLEMIKAGGSGAGSGPTGSSTSYPKGGKPSMSADFNPQKCKATDWVVGGV